MTQFPECDQFLGVRRKVCRGEHTGFPRAFSNRFRAQAGLSPLPKDPDDPDGDEVDSTPAPVRAFPSLLQRVVTFAAALKDHVEDGMAKREENEIQIRLEICQQCPSFLGTRCRECGCTCSSRNTFFNKLAWRSEKCPLGRW